MLNAWGGTIHLSWKQGSLEVGREAWLASRIGTDAAWSAFNRALKSREVAQSAVETLEASRKPGIGRALVFAV